MREDANASLVKRKYEFIMSKGYINFETKPYLSVNIAFVQLIKVDRNLNYGK